MRAKPAAKLRSSSSGAFNANCAPMPNASHRPSGHRVAFSLPRLAVLCSFFMATFFFIEITRWTKNSSRLVIEPVFREARHLGTVLGSSNELARCELHHWAVKRPAIDGHSQEPVGEVVGLGDHCHRRALGIATRRRSIEGALGPRDEAHSAEVCSRCLLVFDRPAGRRLYVGEKKTPQSRACAPW